MRQTLPFGFLLIIWLGGCRRHEVDHPLPVETVQSASEQSVSELRSLDEMAAEMRRMCREVHDLAITAIRSDDLALMVTAKAALDAFYAAARDFETDLWQRGLEQKRIDELMRDLPRLIDLERLDGLEPQPEDYIDLHLLR